MIRNPRTLLERLVTRPDGTSRFARLNVVLIALIVVIAGLVPAFAADPSADAPATTSSTKPEPAVVTGPTTTTAAASTPSTTAAATATTVPAAAPTTTAPAAPTTTAATEPAVDPDEFDGFGPAATELSAKAAAVPVAANPAWPTDCAVNVSILLDRSGSVGNPRVGGRAAYITGIKNAAKALASDLKGTNVDAKVRIAAFAGKTVTFYPTSGEFGNDFTAAAKAIDGIKYYNGSSRPADYGTIPQWHATNWMSAFNSSPRSSDITVMITDGQPTLWDGATAQNSKTALTHAIYSANVLKQAGSRIVAVQVGQKAPTSGTNLAAVTGSKVSEDYFMTDYAGLTSTLKTIAGRACTKAPAIKVEKTADKSVAKEGDTVTYTFTVTNTGTADLAPVTVTDDKLGSIGTIPSLVAGASQTLTKTYVVPAGSPAVTNVVTACGTAAGVATPTCSTATHTLQVARIAIVKSANKSTAGIGSTVTYSFKVTNTGTVALTPVTVTDDKLGAIGTIATLAVGAETTLTKDYTVPTGSTAITNVATACGTNATVQVCASDDHTLQILNLTVEKTANKNAAIVGSNVTYTFKVTNTGTATLNNITVEDDVLGPISVISTLAPSASATFEKVFTVPAGNTAITNIVTACVPVPGSTTEKNCATDTHTLERLNIGLTKTASATTANVGDTVTYTYIVTNTGSAPLTALTLDDDKLGKVTIAKTTLAKGESTTGTAQYTIVAANANTTIVNTATATGKGPNNETLSTTAKASVVVPGVQGTVVTAPPTTVPTPQVKGTSLAYTGSENTGLAVLGAVLLTLGVGILLAIRFSRRRLGMEHPWS